MHFNDREIEIIRNVLYNLANECHNIINNNYLKIKLEGQGSNKFGIGARIEIYAKDQIQIQENYTSRGFQSSTGTELHFGLGDTKTLDVHIKRLRAKIEADPANPVLIQTIRGLGYKLENV